MSYLRKNLANVLTLGNLFSGCIGAVHLMSDQYKITAVCIIVSLLLDFFDGFLARRLGTDTDLGVQLDSLSDMISFGLIPGLVMFKALEHAGSFSIWILPIRYLGLFITVFSGLRLGIFNVDTDQKYYFKGLNTPSNTLLIFGLYYAFMEKESFSFLLSSELLLVLLVLLSSYLLVCPIKMISLKTRSMKLKEIYPQLALALGSLVLLFALGVEAVPLAVVYYILISLVFQKKLAQ